MRKIQLLLILTTIFFFAACSETTHNMENGRWVGSYTDNHRGYYGNETARISITLNKYKDGTCTIMEQTTGCVNITVNYSGTWNGYYDSFADKEYYWYVFNATGDGYSTTLYIDSQGNVYFPMGLSGLERLKQGKPEFKLRKS